MDWTQWKEQSDTSYRVIAFGSSNTATTWSGQFNWVDWLQVNMRTHLGKHVCVVNQGVGGETTDHLLGRIQRDVISFQPQLVIVTIGGNDTFQGFTRHKYADNLLRICETIQQSDGVPVLQTYYCPMYAQGRSETEGTFTAFMEINRKLAQQLQLPMIDQYRRFAPLYRNHPQQYAHLMRDWVHVNHLGNLLMAMHVCEDLALPPLQIPPQLYLEAEPYIQLLNQCSEN